MTPTSEHPEWEAQWAGRWVESTFASMAKVSNDFTKDVKAVVLHPRFPGWHFSVTFSPAGVAVGFEVSAVYAVEPTMRALLADPSTPGDAPPVTGRFLRSLPILEIQEAARAGYLRAAGMMNNPEVAEHWGRVFEDVRRPGRRGRDDRAYAEVAALYVEACRSGSRRPLKDLAERLNYSESQLRNILHAARSKRRGLLTKAPDGRYGGELTPKALGLLKQQGEAE